MTDFKNIELASETNVTAATVNYPSDDGFDLGQYSDAGFELSAADCTITLQASLGGNTWITIMPCVVDLETCLNLAGPIVVGVGGDDFIWSVEDLPMKLIRFSVIFPNNTNSFGAIVTRRP